MTSALPPEVVGTSRWFAGSDTIVVTDNLNEELGRVEDPTRIAAVLAVLGELTDGWTVPETGVPIARLRLNFRAADEPVGNVGVGRKFLSAHVGGGFVSRQSDLATAERLLDAAGARRLYGRLTEGNASPI